MLKGFCCRQVKWLPTFRNTACHHVKVQALLLDCLILKMEEIRCSETSATIYQSTRCHILRNSKSSSTSCEIPKCRNLKEFGGRFQCPFNGVFSGWNSKKLGPLMVAQWLRYCSTNRKVAGSIPDGFTGIFHLSNPSDRTMALGSTQPLTETSARSISWG
jgi:hypothetical protein